MNYIVFSIRKICNGTFEQFIAHTQKYHLFQFISKKLLSKVQFDRQNNLIYFEIKMFWTLHITNVR